MPSYRYYLLDASDRVTDTGLIECDADDQAQARAAGVLTATAHVAIEVWDGGRQVHYAKKPTPEVAAHEPRPERPAVRVVALAGRKAAD